MAGERELEDESWDFATRSHYRKEEKPMSSKDQDADAVSNGVPPSDHRDKVAAKPATPNGVPPSDHRDKIPAPAPSAAPPGGKAAAVPPNPPKKGVPPSDHRGG